MLIIPAIDLQDGCVVRLVQGKHSKKVYSQEPLKTAKQWQQEGARYLHVVDLDGAMQGEPKNLTQVESIVRGVQIPVEFGGGVRNTQTIKRLLDLGVSRVVLGTRAVGDRDFLKDVFAKFNDKVIVSVDAVGEKILSSGWQKEEGEKQIPDFIKELKEIGFTEIIYTDITKDGTLKGPNIPKISQLAKEINVIASGGISCIEDVRELKKLERDGVTGVIVGKALYEGKFTLKEALEL